MNLSASVIETLLNLELSSIEEKKEKGFLVCNQQVHDISTHWDNKKLSVSLTSEDIGKKCGTAPFFVGHTHMLFTAKPSQDDYLYKKSGIPAKGFCTVGYDKILCFDKQDKLIYSKDIGKKFMQTFVSSNRGSLFQGKTLFCDKMQDQKYFCELNDESGTIKPIGIFSNLMLQGGTQAVGYNNPDISFYSHFKNEQIQCLTKHGGSDLVCQVIEK